MPTATADDDEEHLDPRDPAEQGRYGDRDQPTRDDDLPDDPDDRNPPAARQSDR